MAQKMDTRRRFGTVRRLPSGRYQARYTGPDLARHTAPRTFEASGDAHAWLRAEERMVELDVWVSPAARAAKTEGTAEALTVEQYAQAWLDERDLRPKTRAEYRRFWALRVSPYLGHHRLTDLDSAAVRKWWSQLGKDHLTPTANARAYSLAKTILGTAVADELIDRDPFTIKRAGVAPKSSTIRLLTPAELAAITAAMPARYRAAVTVAAWGGLRFGEFTELRRKDVERDGSVIRIRRAVVRVDGQEIVGPPKTSEGIRDVHLPAPAARAVVEHLETYTGRGQDDLIFTTAAGGRVSATRFRDPFSRAVKAAGITDRVRVHDLRHFGAVAAARSGATVKELMGRLGHATPAMSMKYQHAAAGRDAEIAARMSALAEGEK